MSFSWRLPAKKLLARILYRPRPLAGLAAPKLYVYLDAIHRTRDLAGPCLEIGCFMGGTAIPAWQMLQRMGSPREYVCIDTLSGFVAPQFDADVQLGNLEKHRADFQANDLALVRKILRLHRAEGVRLLPGDIVALSPGALPARISVCLIDVDLYVPVLAALEKVYERLEPGGVIVVDDCDESHWQARKAYAEFVASRGLPQRIEFGLGLVWSGEEFRHAGAPEHR